jgi:hypothetical protein
MNFFLISCCTEELILKIQDADKKDADKKEKDSEKKDKASAKDIEK